MAIEDIHIEPVWPDKNPYSPLDMTVSYYAPSDILTIHLSGKPEAAISVPSDAASYEGLYWRIEPEQRRIVGVEIHDFVESFVARHPETLVFAELAGFSDEEMQQIRERINDDYRKHEAASLIFASLARSLHSSRTA